MRLKGHRAIFCAIDTDASMHGVQPDARVVQELLDSGADAARTDDVGRTPLHAAAECGAKEVAQVLIAAGAPLEAQDCDLRTPLHSACDDCGDCSEYVRLPVLRLLLTAGVSVHVRDRLGETPMHKASCCGNVDAVKALLAAGAEVDPLDSREGVTPLYQACCSGAVGVIPVLVEAGADLEHVSI